MKYLFLTSKCNCFTFEHSIPFFFNKSLIRISKSAFHTMKLSVTFCSFDKLFPHTPEVWQPSGEILKVPQELIKLKKHSDSIFLIK